MCLRLNAQVLNITIIFLSMLKKVLIYTGLKGVVVTFFMSRNSVVPLKLFAVTGYHCLGYKFKKRMQ